MREKKALLTMLKNMANSDERKKLYWQRYTQQVEA